jgi:hypothetical protein
LEVSFFIAIFVSTNKNNNIMKTKLHSAVKYEIEYGSNSTFNKSIMPFINHIINILSEETAIFSDDDAWVYSDSVIADRATLISNIDKIITPDSTWDFQEDLEFQLKQINSYNKSNDRKYVYENLKVIIEQSDSRCKDIHFAWY